MIRRLLAGLLFMASAIPTFAQQNYAANLIPADLLPYASAVVRNQEVTIEVKDPENVTYHMKKVITVLNSNGDDLAHMVLFYDKLNSIRNVKGVYYDEFGKQIGKFSESNFEDVYATDGFSLFQDTRVKHYIPSVTTYPYTIECEYELRSKQTLYFPDWEPNPSTGLAVEKSVYTFACRPDFEVRYKEMNLPVKGEVGVNTDKMKTLTWRISNMKAVRPEPYSPEKDKYLSMVKIAPVKFSYAGMEGSFTNWQQLGQWEYDKLLAGRQYLSPATVSEIQALVAGITDDKQKAKKIYEYMQQRTHYVSIQVGIGGYQPFTALDVNELHYGDCKALVNYTRALLKAVNVDSYYCVVEAGREHSIGMLPDFASMNQGDHIILCLPFKSDTTWLECTSQQLPFGYLGDFTDNRLVLACTPQGGKLLRTPKYAPAQNLESRQASFTINAAGDLNGEMTTVFKGTMYDERDGLIMEAPTDRTKEVKRMYPINNLEVQKLDLKQDKSLTPATTEYLKLAAREYASNEDGRISFLIDAANRVTHPPRDIRNRHTDVNINRGYTEEDQITYTLPEGYKMDKVPLNKHIEKPFAKFDAHVIREGNKLIYTRKMQVLDGTYSKDTYQDLVDFFQSVADADAYSVLLVKAN